MSDRWICVRYHMIHHGALLIRDLHNQCQEEKQNVPNIMLGSDSQYWQTFVTCVQNGHQPNI